MKEIEVHSEEWYLAGPAMVPCEICVSVMQVDSDCPKCNGSGYVEKWKPKGKIKDGEMKND